MYIEPNSTVILLHGVPLDNRYEHTICWDDYTTAAGKEAQYNYFNNPARRLQILTKQTYQRYNRNYIKVAIPTDNLYNCNYMMFQNTSYGNKWFYAFVTNVSYVNGNGQTGTTLIEYEIDRMQTWYFDYELMQCFVEREHSATDEVGDNIVDEGLNTGDYYYEPLQTIRHQNFSYLISYYPNKDSIVYTGGSYSQQDQPFVEMKLTPSRANQNVFSYYDNGFINTHIYIDYGLKIAIPCANDTYGSAEDKLKKLLDLLTFINCEIISIQLIPSDFLSNYLSENYFLYECEWRTDPAEQYFGDILNTKLPKLDETIEINRVNTFNGYNSISYTPKNNKMFISPYCGLLVKTSQNDSTQLDYKLSGLLTEGKIRFKHNIYLCPDCVESVVPQFFNGSGTNYDYTITLDKYPNINFSIDSYTKWWNVNKGSIATRLIASGIRGVGMVAAAYTGGASVAAASGVAATIDSLGKSEIEAKRMVDKAHTIGDMRTAGTTQSAGLQAATSLLGDVVNTLGSISNASNMADSYTNAQYNPELSYMNGHTQIDFMQMNILPQNAKIIDSYFTRFGYATKMTKVPNRNVRTHFCYTKTVGCEINGELPQSERDIICSVYDSGITFWKNPAEIGDFSINNPPM